MTLSAHGVPLARQSQVPPMRISVSNAAACRTAARPSGSQRPAGRSRLDFSLMDVCHPYRKFLSTTLLSVLGPQKLRGPCAECGASGCRARTRSGPSRPRPGSPSFSYCAMRQKSARFRQIAMVDNSHKWHDVCAAPIKRCPAWELRAAGPSLSLVSIVR